MNSSWQLSLSAGTGLLLVATTQAQAPVKLLGTGDTVSLGTVRLFNNIDVNNNGDWLVELLTEPGSGSERGIFLNGTLVYRERTNMGIPASHAADWHYDGIVDTMDINDNGDTMVLMHVQDSVAPTWATDSDLLIWTSGTTGIPYVLFAEGETPNLADPDQAMLPLWGSIFEVWQNNNNQMIISGRSNTDNDDMLVFIEHDGAGLITSQTLFAIDRVNHAVAFPPSNGIHATNVQGWWNNKANASLNNAGQKMFYVDDNNNFNAPVGSSNVDFHYYVDTTEVGWDGDLAPFDPITMTQDFWNHASNSEFDINDSGTFAAGWRYRSPNGLKSMIVTSSDLGATITPFVRRGEALFHNPSSGFTYRNFKGTIDISASGDLTWGADWNDPDVTIDAGLYRNSTLLLQEGVSTDEFGAIIKIISTEPKGRAVSDNGRYIIQLLFPVGTGFGAYLIDTASVHTSYCFGDGTASSAGCGACPCGNYDVPGSAGGCLNSSGTSGMLVPSGIPEVGNDTLRFEVNGATPSTFGVLVSGIHLLPNGTSTCATGSGIPSLVLDGLRCVGGSLLRHGTRAIDANGDIGSTGAGWGPPSGPAGGLRAFSGLMTGQTRKFQCFYREDALLGCQTGQNTTNAVSVTFL